METCSSIYGEVEMEEQQGQIQSIDTSPRPFEGSMYQRPVTDTVGRDETVPRRLEWIAVILFIVSYVAMIYSYALFMSDEVWGLTVVAINTATAIILLLSVALSIFGMTKLSKVVLGMGIIGLMFLVVSIGLKLMQAISEYHDYWSY